MQLQIRKIKLLKGIGYEGPTKKQTGWLSIESDKNAHNWVVFRSYAGQTQFSAIVSKECKIKQTFDKPNRFRLKFQCKVRNDSKFEIEHCEACFLNSKDMLNFKEIWEALFV